MSVRTPFHRACTRGSLTDYEDRTSSTLETFNPESASATLKDIAEELRITRRDLVAGTVLNHTTHWEQLTREYLDAVRGCCQQAKHQHKSRFYVLLRHWGDGGRYYSNNVAPLMTQYERAVRLHDTASELHQKAKAESQAVEVRSTTTGSEVGVYSLFTGKVSWRKKNFALGGCYNPLKKSIVWRSTMSGSVSGCWDPEQEELVWKENVNGAVAVVYNRDTRKPEFKTAAEGAVNGVYNPNTLQVEWRTSKGCIVGYFDYETLQVVWIERPAASCLCVVYFDKALCVYASSYSYTPRKNAKRRQSHQLGASLSSGTRRRPSSDGQTRRSATVGASSSTGGTARGTSASASFFGRERRRRQSWSGRRSVIGQSARGRSESAHMRGSG